MRWLMALAAAGALLVSGGASAGCPNLCEISEATFTVEPELPCAVVEARSSDCDCGIDLHVRNECEQPLDALSFEFASCGPSAGPFTMDCGVVAPTEQGRLEQPIHELGTSKFRFTLRHEGRDHVITTQAQVSSFDDGAICSVTRGAGRARSSSSAWLFAALTTLALLRRGRRD